METGSERLIPGNDSGAYANDKAEIVIYQTLDNQTNLEVRFENDTIWLTQAQIVSLFSSSKANVSEHIKHIYQSQELEEQTTVRKIRTVHIEGGRQVFRYMDHQTVYHIGASLKDLGRKWFAFSKIELDVKEMIDRLET